MRATEVVLARVRERLPPNVRLLPTAQPDVSYDVRIAPDDISSGRPHVIAFRSAADGEWLELARVPDADTAASTAADDAEFRIALHSPVRLFVHAAAVAWRGRMLVVPGRTWTGKSTLAAALVRAGAAYYSDEFTVIDEAGLVHAFPRPLRLRADDASPERCVTASPIRGVETAEPLPLGLVVSAPFRRGARWSPRAMSAGEIALALMGNAVVARTRPAHAMMRIARAMEWGVGGLQGERGEADEIAQSLLDRVSESRVETSTD